MKSTQFLYAPELSRFETPESIAERLEDEYDLAQYRARRDGLEYTGHVIEKGRGLQIGILELAREHGFDFLGDSIVGVLYYEPLATREAHIDTKGRTLIVTTSGCGSYLQYPNTDEYKDKVCLEEHIAIDEAEFTRAVTAGYALLANQSIPHSFHSGSLGRTAFYITA